MLLAVLRLRSLCKTELRRAPATCQGANLGNNTFRNIIAVNYGIGNYYPPIAYYVHPLVRDDGQHVYVISLGK